MEDSKLFCKKCGKEIENETTFCPNCGTKLITEEISTKSDSRDGEAIAGFVLGLVSLVLWVTLIIPILGIYFSNKGKKSSKASYAKAGKVLSILSLVLPIIVAIIWFLVIIIPVITTTVTVKVASKNASNVSAIPTSEEYTTGQKEIYDWYTTLGIIQAETSDIPPATVRVDIALGYKKDDKATSTEITKRTVEIKAFLRRYFSGKTAAEIRDEINEDNLENEIKEGINDKILMSSQIRDVVFQQKDVIE